MAHRPVGKKKYIKLVHSAWFRAVTKRCEFYDVTKSLGFNQKKKKKKTTTENFVSNRITFQ
jgi:hypothetical protein